MVAELVRQNDTCCCKIKVEAAKAWARARSTNSSCGPCIPIGIFSIPLGKFAGQFLNTTWMAPKLTRRTEVLANQSAYETRVCIQRCPLNRFIDGQNIDWHCSSEFTPGFHHGTPYVPDHNLGSPCFKEFYKVIITWVPCIGFPNYTSGLNPQFPPTHTFRLWVIPMNKLWIWWATEMMFIASVWKRLLQLQCQCQCRAIGTIGRLARHSSSIQSYIFLSSSFIISYYFISGTEPILYINTLVSVLVSMIWSNIKW